MEVFGAALATLLLDWQPSAQRMQYEAVTWHFYIHGHMHSRSRPWTRSLRVRRSLLLQERQTGSTTRTTITTHPNMFLPLCGMSWSDHATKTNWIGCQKLKNMLITRSSAEYWFLPGSDPNDVSFAQKSKRSQIQLPSLVFAFSRS